MSGRVLEALPIFCQAEFSKITLLNSRQTGISRIPPKGRDLSPGGGTFLAVPSLEALSIGQVAIQPTPGTARRTIRRDHIWAK
jgi:hypothetical protein